MGVGFGGRVRVGGGSEVGWSGVVVSSVGVVDFCFRGRPRGFLGSLLSRRSASFMGGSRDGLRFGASIILTLVGFSFCFALLLLDWLPFLGLSELELLAGCWRCTLVGSA